MFFNSQPSSACIHFCDEPPSIGHNGACWLRPPTSASLSVSSGSVYKGDRVTYVTGLPAS